MVPWLDPNNDLEPFPSPETSLDEPNGLLAAGGSLNPERLLSAYRQGIFPWFEDDQPILWWSPNPRMVIKPSDTHVSRSLRKIINQGAFDCTFDTAFNDVIHACSSSRELQAGTWITPSMVQAYQTLFELGSGHSVEVWLEGELVGGLYGVSIGRVFFGESMFSLCSNASKIGFVFLSEQLNDWGYQLIDCQVQSQHLKSLGASTISRRDFSMMLGQLCPQSVNEQAWRQ
ncbi:MAG: leucyl/phenylalanyl-tRNA--protein transferase [Gammaproteobacteria bacterium]|nr:leucyl/phenylalanyl-tRNA--protein transferase [Cycloclasticus sp.]MBQ0775275.1 leucyl/phenylalanyl-tRNA--protein transferase [Gammaproteobacteria bacterium]